MTNVRLAEQPSRRPRTPSASHAFGLSGPVRSATVMSIRSTTPFVGSIAWASHSGGWAAKGDELETVGEVARGHRANWPPQTACSRPATHRCVGVARLGCGPEGCAEGSRACISGDDDGSLRTHLIDQNLWAAAARLGDISGTRPGDSEHVADGPRARGGWLGVMGGAASGIRTPDLRITRAFGIAPD